MHLVPGRAIDDRLVLARMAVALVHRLAEVDAVAEDLVDRPLVDRLARPMLAVLRRPAISWCGRRAAAPAPASVAEPEPQEAGEDQPDQLGFLLVHHQLAVDDVVAERRDAAHPHPLPARGGELVADALADHLALELGEREQDVQRQPAHRRRRVERLSQRTNETLCRSKTSTMRAKSPSERDSRSTL